MSPRIQIVEDERIVALDLKASLKKLGFDPIAIAASGEMALTQAREHKPDLVLMDIHLEGEMRGTTAAQILRDELGIPVVFLTAFAEEHTLQQAESSAPYGYLLKPFELRELNATLRMALSRHQVEKETRRQHRQLQLALDCANLGIWEWDPQGGTMSSQGTLPGAMMGFEPLRQPAPLPPLLSGLSCHDRQQLLRQLAQQHSALIVCPLPRQDKEATLWLEITVRQFLDDKDSQPRLIGVVRDVSDRIVMETQLRQASAVFHSTAEGIAIVSADRHIQMGNPAFLAATGYALHDIIGMEIDQVLHDRRHPSAFYQHLASQQGGVWNGEVLCKRKNGELFPAWEHICAVHDEQEKLSHFIVAFSDISAIRNVQKELNHMAFHDALTGLGNRHLLQEQLTVELDKARLSNSPLGLLFIDLDGFKLVNDSLGHPSGDRLLQIVASRLKDTIRRADIATRFGGDEFFIICPGSAADACQTLASRIIQALEQPTLLADETVIISGSIGISLYPAHGTAPEHLLRAADSAMYEAKSGGKSRYAMFDEGMAERVRTRMHIEQSLRRAIKRKEFELHYQPLFSLKERRLHGFEALVRWQDRGQLIPPDGFIPIAEECGLIHELGEWVLRQACQQAKQWQDRFDQPIRVAVNVSARQFAAPDFVKKVGLALLESGLYPHLLELEVTESTLQVMEDSQRILAELKALGISIAIDDFGTGFSSMALLKHLTIDRLKIDRSFVKDTPADLRDSAICRAIVALAHSLMLGITAEGIETDLQAEFMESIGCDTGQGYLFSRPMVAALTTTFILTHQDG